MTPDAENFHEQPDILQERLSAYLDDMLDADERAHLEAHLADCGTCQRQLAELRQVRALLRALPQPALPRSFLLPVEGGEAASPAPARGQPVPLRSASRRQQVARMARAVQWLGTIAAVLGLALLVSTAVLGGTRGAATMSSAETTSGGASGTSSDTNHLPSYDDSQSAPGMATAKPTKTPGTPVPQGTSGATGAKSPAVNQGQGNSPQSPSLLLILQVAGGALVVAGVALVVASSVTRRRHVPA